MSRELNLDPTKFYSAGTYIQAEYDSVELRKRKENLKTGNKIVINGRSKGPYSVKLGDIMVYFNGRETVFPTVDSINLTEYGNSEALLDRIEFAGIAFSGFDPSQTRSLPMLVDGVVRMSYKGDHLSVGDKVRLTVPKFTSGTAEGNYIDKYKDRRITFGIEKSPGKIVKPIQWEFMSGLGKIGNNVAGKSNFLKKWKQSDISKFINFSKWAVDMGLMKWADNFNDIKKDMKYKAVASGTTNNANAVLMGVFAGGTGKYTTETDTLWDSIYNMESKKSAIPEGRLDYIRQAPVDSINELYQKFREEKSKEFATVISNSKSRGLELKLN